MLLLLLLMFLLITMGQYKRNSLKIGGIYGEHQQLGVTNKDATSLELQLEQKSWWRRITKNWKEASVNSKCIDIGDMNMDFNRWNDPEQHLAYMVEH